MNMRNTHTPDTAFDANAIAVALARLYEESFGGKERGRYRISSKFLRQIAGRKRLYAEEIEAIGRALFEQGFVLIDLESFVVVLSQKTFDSYRRVNEASIWDDAADPDPGPGRASDSPA
ncbi:MAG: hypothetical protein O3A96_07620 [Proteobacteria bacterium]|nr:hypothetical protein [Pseudomonadota bacterium]